MAAEGETVTGVPLKIKDGVAHYAGLETCGSTWSCTVCEPKISNRRADEISVAAGAWERAGNSVYMVTPTVPHDLGMRLADLLPLIADSWRALIGGRPWRTLREQVGIAGQVRSMEVTCGCNGWHPHLHVLLFVEGAPGSAGLFEMHRYFLDKWQSVIVAAGYRRPDDQHGVVITRCPSAEEAGRYIAKTATGKPVGNELARGDLKTGRKGHRTPFEILEDYRQHPNDADLKLWREYELATKGHRKITWSKGLRKLISELADLGEEKSDEEIAAEEIGGDDLVVIDTVTWRKIVRAPGLCGYLLDQAERGGAAAVIEAAARFKIRIVDRGGGP